MPSISPHLAIPHEWLTYKNERERAEHAASIKNSFTCLADEKLPDAMGQEYASIAVSCLICLDRDEEAGLLWGVADTKDNEGIVVGVKFIQFVLQRVHGIRV